MSNIPGISPLTPDLEDIKHSDDPAFDDTRKPDDSPQDGEDTADETEEQTAARIERKTIDLA
jgi:hypothetical protein